MTSDFTREQKHSIHVVYANAQDIFAAAEYSEEYCAQEDLSQIPGAENLIPQLWELAATAAKIYNLLAPFVDDEMKAKIRKGLDTHAEEVGIWLDSLY